jgi:hypothetical protein
MPSVILPTQAAAQALCDLMARLLGIPDPVRYPGTARWAEPRELTDGTWAVAVPRKGALREVLDTLDLRPVAAAKLLTEDQVDALSGRVTPKRSTPAELADVRAKITAAREVLATEVKVTVFG